MKLTQDQCSTLGLKADSKKKRLRIDAIPTRKLPKSCVERHISQSSEKRLKEREERYKRHSCKRLVSRVFWQRGFAQ